jgi:ATP synthase protein I
MVEGTVTDGRATVSRPRFLRTTLSQLLVALVAALTVFLAAGVGSALSFSSGAACSILPQLFFALRMERAATQGAERAARLGLAAEAGKLALSAACFALVFAVLKPPRPELVFVGFAVMWLIQLVEAAMLLRQAQGGRRR